MTTFDQDTMAEKVIKLLNKAERASTPAEAEAFSAKAYELMARHALDDAMLQAARDGGRKEEIIEKAVTFTGGYAGAQLDLGHSVGKAMGCRTLQSTYNGKCVLFLVGFESDVHRAETLIASLLIQGAAAMKVYAKEVPAYLSAFERFAERRAFLIGFAAEVGRRLHAAKVAAKAEVIAEAGDQAEAVSTSMALVLKSNAERVDDWIDQRYGKLRSSRRRGASLGSGSGYSSGRQAGTRADVGSPRIGGRKALGR